MLRARCDYILSTDQHLFKLVGIRHMSNYSSDHFALRAGLLQRPMRCHSRYLWDRCVFPLSFSTAAEIRLADTNFQARKALKLLPPTPFTCSPLPLWMSLAAINLIDKRASLRRNPCHCRNVARDLTKSVRRYLLDYFQWRADNASVDIRECLESSMGYTNLRGA